MKIFKKFFIILFGIILTGCSALSDSSNTITIGVVFPLTGEDSDEGLRAYNGLRLAISEINANGGVLGKNLDIIVLNDQGDETVVLEQYNKLKEKNVSAIIGSCYSGVSIAMANEAVNDNMPMIATTATSSELTIGKPNVFRLAYTDDYQVRIMVDFAKTKLNAKTAAVLYNTDDSASFNDGSIFKELFEADGGQVVFMGGYSTANSNFESVVDRFIDNEPDVIFCSEDCVTMSEILLYSYGKGIKTTKFLGTDMWDGLLAYTKNANSLNNAYFCTFYSYDDPSETTQEFVKKYREAFNEMPLAGSAIAYDTAYVLAEALKNAGSTEREKIIEALKATDLTVITGHVTFDQDNNPTKDACIIGFKNAQYYLYEKITP